MKITLFPLEKIMIDDKSLYLGANKDEFDCWENRK